MQIVQQQQKATSSSKSDSSTSLQYWSALLPKFLKGSPETIAPSLPLNHITCALHEKHGRPFSWAFHNITMNTTIATAITFVNVITRIFAYIHSVILKCYMTIVNIRIIALYISALINRQFCLSIACMHNYTYHVCSWLNAH